MPARRRANGVHDGRRVHFELNGQVVEARAGETIGAALLAIDRVCLRHTARRGKPRGLHCAMGVCFDCLIVVDGQPNLRACMTPVRHGIRVEVPRATDAV